jgi:hypothetical protein
MTAIREQVLAALKVRLETLLPAVPGLAVFRNRTKGITAPALNVQDGPQQKDSSIVAMQRTVMSVAIAGYVEATSDEEIGPALNDLYGRVIDALEADVTLSADLSGNGPAFDLREGGLDVDLGTDADGAPLETPAGWFYLTVEIEFTTRQGGSGQLAP